MDQHFCAHALEQNFSEQYHLETSWNESSHCMGVTEESKRSTRTLLKSRTGCKTCKIRRIKCDETLPACQRCSKSGWKCDGSSLTVKPSQADTARDVVSLSQNACLTNSVSTSTRQPEEQRAFQFFCERLAPILASFTVFTDNFWKTTIPQVSHSEAVIWHMLVAIGSQQEMVSRVPHDDTTNVDHLYLKHLYLKHHSQALTITTQTKSKWAVEVVLMACMMFIVSENGHGIDTITTGGLFHLIFGLKILKEWKRNHCNSRTTSDIISTVIEPMFLQLEIVLSLFSMPPSATIGIIYDKEDVRPRLPESFSDLFIAQHLFINIWRWRFQQKGAWTASSLAFKEIHVLLTAWHRLLVSYVRALNDAEIMEKYRGMTLIAQYRLLYLAFMYSTRTDIPETNRIRPSLVDLSNLGKIIFSYVLPPCAVSEQTDLNWQVDMALDQDQVRLWPITETAQSSGHRGVIRLTCSVAH